jgi:ABC-2 type transport system permease protein
MRVRVTAIRQYGDLVIFHLQTVRDQVWFLVLIEVVFAAGLVFGFGYVIPEVSDTTALYLVTGTATQMIIMIGLVSTPQMLSQDKAEGRLEYMLTLPISREAYLMAQVTAVALFALPGILFAVGIGFWHYGLTIQFDLLFLLVAPLAITSLAGVGVAMAVVIPHPQITNALTQLIIFYALFFSPVILPKDQLPAFLGHVADFMPTTYVADAVRATLTDLPGTNLGKSLTLMLLSSVVSLALSSATIRRRG